MARILSWTTTTRPAASCASSCKSRSAEIEMAETPRDAARTPRGRPLRPGPLGHHLNAELSGLDLLPPFKAAIRRSRWC